MRLVFWGTRGSTVTPDPEYSRYGGNTACIELALSPSSSILLDAGMGMRWQALRMLKERSHGNQIEVLLSHCYWDHIQGIPFNPLVFVPGNRMLIHGSGSALLENLKAQLREEFCPVPDFFEPDIGSDVQVNELIQGSPLEALGVSVQHATLPRDDRGNTVTGYRLEHVEFRLAYLTDVVYPEGPEHCPEAIELARQVDVLIYGTQASYQEALHLARLSQAKRLICTHHDPDHNDDELDRISQDLAQATDLKAELAREGTSLKLTS